MTNRLTGTYKPGSVAGLGAAHWKLRTLERLCPAALHSSCTDLHPLNTNPRLALQLLESRVHFSCCEITYSIPLKLKDYRNSVQDPKAKASTHYTQACLQPAQVTHYIRTLESDSAPAQKKKKPTTFFFLVLACCRAAPESQSSDDCNSLSFASPNTARASSFCFCSFANTIL